MKDIRKGDIPLIASGPPTLIEWRQEPFDEYRVPIVKKKVR